MVTGFSGLSLTVRQPQHRSDNHLVALVVERGAAMNALHPRDFAVNADFHLIGTGRHIRGHRRGGWRVFTRWHR
jgi:hypothetical protein